MWMDNWVLNTPPALWPVKGSHPFLFRFFEPKRPVVVLANANQAEQEAHVHNCAVDNIPILRRKGGGGTVLLAPGCLIFTMAFYAQKLFGNREYFHQINGLWIDALKSQGIGGLSQNGLSDLCIGEKKLAGTSLFRRKHLLVYQGSLLVHMDVDAMEKYLAHPSREPEYRQKRRHKEFLISLRDLGYEHPVSQLAQGCTSYVKAHLNDFLSQNALSREEICEGSSAARTFL